METTVAPSKLSKEKEHIERCHALAAEWFREHRAEAWPKNHADVVAVEWIRWRRPGTSNYSVDYLLFNNYIVVTGDLGEAVYGWSQKVSRENFMSFDWHYFWSKCCASETGRQYTQKIPGVKHAVPNVRAIAHFIGLKMAFKQLAANI